MDTVHIGFPNLVYVPVGSRVEKKRILRNWGVTGVVHCLSYCSLALFMGNIHGHCSHEFSKSSF